MLIRFVEVFINLSKENRKLLFLEVKQNLNSSWEKFYPSLEISRPMLYNYISGKYDIPEKIFFKLLEISNIESIEHEKIFKEKYFRKKIKNPPEDIFLAEIFGVLNGDGHLSSKNYEISVIGNLLEKDYFVYLKNIFEKTFKIKFKIEKFSHHIKLRTYSKDLCYLLNEKYSIPLGKKIGQLRIPKMILDSEEFLIYYIRGLFDTDGGINLRRKNEMMIHITSADKNYLEEIGGAMKKLGFKIARSDKKILIYRRDEIEKFFEKVKPANSKHLKKFKIYSKL